MKNIKKFICSILVFTLVMTNTLIFPTPASAAGTAPVKLESLTPGDTVSFGGVTWIVLEPGSGLLLMRDYYRTYLGSIEINSFAFDSSGSTSYDPSSVTNIAYRLNNEFYNSLGSDSALIVSKNWNIGPLGHEGTPTVNCKIGMLSMSRAELGYTTYNNLGSISNDWWTLTPMDGGGVNLRTGNGAIGGSVDATYSEMVRPALYLPLSVLVSGGNGGTVLGGTHNIPAITGISPVEGSSQGGTEVTVSGTALSEATEVYFGSMAGAITDVSDTSITVTAPEGTGPVDITVTNPYGTSQTSAADQFQYILTQATPAFSPAAGEVDFGTELQLISTGAEHIYYTTDGTDPSTSSTEYNDATRPVIDSAMTVKAIATASGKADSKVASASYTQGASADLADIVISGTPGNFTFTPDQYTYNGLTVASGIDHVTVTPTGAGVIQVNGIAVTSGHASTDIALTEGVTKNITVVATESGRSPKTYSINITRAQPAASITKNSVTTNYDTLSAALAAAHNDTITLLRDVTELVVLTATTNNTITIDGQGHTITGADCNGQGSAALTLSGDGNVILKSLTLRGGAEPSFAFNSSGLLVSGGSVNVLCEGTVNAYGGSNNSYNSIGLIHSGSGSVNITNATGGSAQQSSFGVQNNGAGTVNVTNATAGITGGISYGVDNGGAGTVNVTNASGASAVQSVGVDNHGTGTVNVASASGGAATYYSFGVNNTYDTGSVNVANVSMVPGGTYGNNINGVDVNMNVTTLNLNRGPGESCVLDTITIASAGSTTIGILPGVLKDGIVYSWYEDSAKTNPFSGTTVTGTANLYSGLPVAASAINISEISGVTAPVTGETPVSSISDTDQYTASISWSPNGSVFAAGTIYTATITLTPKDGYTLSGVGEGFFSVPGVMTTNPTDSGVVTAIFPRTERTIASLAADINTVPGLTATINGSKVTVTGTATLTSTSDAALTFYIPEDVTVVWKAALSGGGSKYLLEPTGDGTFEVADGADIVSTVCQTVIYCDDGKGQLNINGGKVSATAVESMAIGVADDWLLTMTGGEVAADEDNSITIFAKSSAIMTGGTVSAKGTDGYQFYMGGTSVYRSSVLDPSKIMYNTSDTFAEVSIGAAVTQAVLGMSTGLTVTGHNLSAGDSVTAVWGKQNGESGVNISYYSAKNTTTLVETCFFAVPGVTITTTSGGSPTTATPTNQTQDTDNTVPTIAGSDAKGWSAITESIGQLITAGESENTTGSITINMNQNAIVPAEIFHQIKGHDTTVIFRVADGIEWVINGNDVTGDFSGSDLNDLDLDVDLGVNNIPEDLLANLPASDNSVQFSLAHDGGYGFTATLSMNLNEQNHGKMAYLYFYNTGTKQLELQEIRRIDEKGNAEFDFVHASDYVIVMDNGETLQKQIDGITITPSKKVLYLGGNMDKSTTLSVKLPEILKTEIENGSSSYTISYTSGNSKIATVTSNGKVTAKKAGTAVITTVINVNGIERSIQTKITVKKAYIKLIKSTVSMKEGEQYTFQAKGYGIDTAKITWTTSENAIVVINKKSGSATAKTTGTDFVIAKYKDISVKMKVIVKK